MKIYMPDGKELTQEIVDAWIKEEVKKCHSPVFRIKRFLLSLFCERSLN
jgi:hypothetical protein